VFRTCCTGGATVLSCVGWLVTTAWAVDKWIKVVAIPTSGLLAADGLVVTERPWTLKLASTQKSYIVIIKKGAWVAERGNPRIAKGLRKAAVLATQADGMGARWPSTAYSSVLLLHTMMMDFTVRDTFRGV
jgi:hypothetical protein